MYRKDELYHYGVKGMKWGVVRDIARGGAKAYNKISDHGSSTMQKQSRKYDNKAARSAYRGQKIRSKYYQHKSDKLQDRSFNDIESFYAGIKDYSLKAESVVIASKIGAKVVKNMFNAYKRKRTYQEVTGWIL